MDDRSLFRFKPGYEQIPVETAFDWSEWGGFASAAEMCNNNGACRKSDPGVMCPSYRATGDEQHLTRGRANSLRLALSGQLGPDALTSDEMRRDDVAVRLVQGLPRECPTGVDMAKMKLEFLAPLQEAAQADPARPADRLPAALRAGRLGLFADSSICGSPADCWHGSARACSALAPNGPCRTGRRTSIAARPAAARVARSSYSSTPSTAISSRKTPKPPSGC